MSREFVVDSSQAAKQILRWESAAPNRAWSISEACYADRRLQVYTPDGGLATTYSAYQDALGVKDVSWNASGDLLSVGSYDEVSAAVCVYL